MTCEYHNDVKQWRDTETESRWDGAWIKTVCRDCGKTIGWRPVDIKAWRLRYARRKKEQESED